MLALFLVLPPAAAPTCPAGWTPSPPNAAWGPRCFLVPPERSTSLSHCVDLCAKDERGGIPACIGSAEENKGAGVPRAGDNILFFFATFSNQHVYTVEEGARG